jgi:hypothetical protein
MTVCGVKNAYSASVFPTVYTARIGLIGIREKGYGEIRRRWGYSSICRLRYIGQTSYTYWCGSDRFRFPELRRL